MATLLYMYAKVLSVTEKDIEIFYLITIYNQYKMQSPLHKSTFSTLVLVSATRVSAKSVECFSRGLLYDEQNPDDSPRGETNIYSDRDSHR